MMYSRGVGSTSLDDVLAEAGCGKSQLYYYFENKSELVRAVIDRQLELILSNQPALDGVDSWVGLRRWADQVLALHQVPGGPFSCPLGAMAAELKNDPAYIAALDAAFVRWEEPLRHGLHAMRSRGRLSQRADPDRLARTVMAALQGGMLMARVHDDYAVLKDALDGALRLLRQHAATPPRALAH
jgi:TetR/AcrR family transcriptional repressor of nem operon